MSSVKKLEDLHKKIIKCKKCPHMCGPPIPSHAVKTEILLIGQAPGSHEAKHGKPFANTAGRTLFKWLESSTGMTEEETRKHIYISALARCFPGKSKNGAGDRVPSANEIANCRPHLQEEIKIIKPKLVLVLGKLAISEMLGSELFSKSSKLEDIVGKSLEIEIDGHATTVVALPHPSGVSRWHQQEPGKTKLTKALNLIKQHSKKLQTV